MPCNCINYPNCEHEDETSMVDNVLGLHAEPRPLIPNNSLLADMFLDAHDPSDWYRKDFGNHGLHVIDLDKIPDLRDNLVDFIANVVSSILDAGSERDAVNENVALHDVIEAELKGWIA